MIETICNAGCKQKFTVQDFQQNHLDGGVDKTFFTCPHCHREYVAFYTDSEIRILQEKIRKAQQKLSDQRYDQHVVNKQVAKIRDEIKAKMDDLRKRIERYGQLPLGQRN